VKKCVWMTCVLAVMLATASDGFARERKQRARKPRRQHMRKPADDFAMMATVLKLEGEAKQKLDAQIAAGAEALKEWEQGDGAKLKELMKAQREARKAKDAEKAKQLAAEMKPLRAAKTKLAADNKAKVMALLTDEQKAGWAGYKLRKDLQMRHFRRVKLSDEQAEQMQALCVEAAKTLPPANDPKQRKARADALKKLSADISEKVLTAEQREQMAKKPERKPKAAKKPRKPKAKKQPADEGEMGNPEW